MDNKYLVTFREMISLRGLTGHTLKNYCTYIRAYLDYLTDILHKSPEDVSWNELRDYIRWLQKSRNLSDRTINCAISQLRFFTMYVLHRPWDDTQLPMRRFDEYLPYVPSQEETWQFISTMPDLKQRTMVTLMYSSGLRIGEVCRLRYEDVDPKNMRLHITHSKNRNDRFAILSKAALALLTRYWIECGRPKGFLFPKQNGEDHPIDTFFLSRHIHAHEKRLLWDINLCSPPPFTSIFPAMLSAVPSVLLTVWQVNAMSDYKIRQIFEQAYDDYSAQGHFQPDVQHKAAHAILNCKSGRLGFNLSQCTDCGHIEIHNNSCRNRNCPNCQAVLKEIWVDRRRAEVINTPYFHVVFTLPHELNPLIYCNQKLLYGLLHRCCSETLLELSADKKWLGAVPGIIQVLHTWNQELAYHVHMHCIVSGGGLTKDGRIRKSSKNFFIRTEVLRDKFKGKYMAHLFSLYESGSLNFSFSCEKLGNSYNWKEWKNRLYEKDWCPYIKETFNGFGNAMEYLGRYTHKIAISNSRILNLTEDMVTFSARGKKPSEPKRRITLEHTEFIRRYRCMYCLPVFRKYAIMVF